MLLHWRRQVQWYVMIHPVLVAWIVMIRQILDAMTKSLKRLRKQLLLHPL
jgi:hypothetical protein